MAFAPNDVARSAGDAGRADAFWPAVGAIVDRAPTVADLRAHGLHLVAAAWWREQGRELPPELKEAELAASLRVLAAESLLERIRGACDGPLILMKGYEVAARYPEPTQRPFTDIDLLVPEPERTFEALLRSGFEPIGYDAAHYGPLHHLRPLCLPQLPIVVELHRRPEWVRWSTPPSAQEILEHAVASRSRVDGLLAPSPAHHALIVAAHSWAGMPLRRLGDVVDTALLAAAADPEETRAIARRWDVNGLWAFNERVHEMLFRGAEPPLAVRLWGRAALSTRDPIVLAQHTRRILGPFAVLPVSRAVPQAVVQLALEVQPNRGETWHAKLRRVGLALRHAFVRRSQHDARLSERGHRD